MATIEVIGGPKHRVEPEEIPQWARGPWFADVSKGYPIVRAPTGQIAHCGTFRSVAGEEGFREQAANARLISAAPELFEALAKAREFIRNFTPREDHLGDCAKDAAITADAALAKAQGEST